jgi:hypothetical protein
VPKAAAIAHLSDGVPSSPLDGLWLNLLPKTGRPRGPKIYFIFSYF